MFENLTFRSVLDMAPMRGASGVTHGQCGRVRFLRSTKCMPGNKKHGTVRVWIDDHDSGLMVKAINRKKKSSIDAFGVWVVMRRPAGRLVIGRHRIDRPEGKVTELIEFAGSGGPASFGPACYCWHCEPRTLSLPTRTITLYQDFFLVASVCVLRS